jgi:3-(3-hydroxy-phenyl)propionate hydroxylase
MPETTQTQDKPPAALAAAFTNGYEFAQGAGYTLPEYPFVEPPELRTGEVKRHAVVIVGGGITGLTLACALAQYGIKAVLLDEDNTVGVKGASSRGICYARRKRWRSSSAWASTSASPPRACSGAWAAPSPARRGLRL